MERRKPSKRLILNRLKSCLLKKYSPKDADIIAGDIYIAMTEAQTPHEVDKAIQSINNLLKGYGTEVLTDGEWRRYWLDTAFVYVNMGDTYAPTVIYDIDHNRWLVTSWGDIVEAQARRFGI